LPGDASTHMPLRTTTALLATLILLASATGCGDGVAGPALATEAGAPATTRAPFRFFSPTSFWNRPAAGLPLDPRSRELTSALASEALREQQSATGPKPTIDTTAYSVPIYTVPESEPPVRVTLLGTPHPELSLAWSAVPIPPGAQPAVGTDGDMVIWQPSTDRMWEFWRATYTAEGWQASWGGAMQHVRSSSGVYEPRSWPGAKPWWGVPASSLALVGGLITLEDLQKASINHALAISIPNVRADEWAAPAKRTDGTSHSPLSLPEGAHLRLDPRLNLDALHLPRLTLLIAKAAQRYGLYVRDRSPNIGLYSQDPTPTGVNPYAGADGYLEGRAPSDLLASFPWQHLQLVRMRLNGQPTRTSKQ
jgi:hypothetical protein